MLPICGVPATIQQGLAPYRDLFCRDEGFAHISRYLRCGKVTPASEFGQDALPATSVIALAQVGIIATPSGQSATSQRFHSGPQRTREYACVGCAVAQRPAPAASCQQIEPPSACW